MKNKTKLRRFVSGALAVVMSVSTLFASCGTPAYAQTADDAAVTAPTRLIVTTEDESLLENNSCVVAEHDGVYILQYKNEEQAENAYVELSENDGTGVQKDTLVSIASDETSENTEATDTVMTENENPIAELEDLIKEDSRNKENQYDIALIDTGASVGKNVLKAVSVIGDDASDDNGHGTKMTELMAEQNPDVRILSIKALDAEGKGDISAVYAAMEYAINCGVRVINLSISAKSDSENSIIETEVKKAQEAGIIVVGAAGNDSTDAADTIPGGIADAVIVGACDENGNRLEKSNYGATVDFYASAGSTSEAAAKASGIISLVKEEEQFNIIDNKNFFLIKSKNNSGHVELKEGMQFIIEPDGYEEQENAEDAFYICASISGSYTVSSSGTEYAGDNDAFGYHQFSTNASGWTAFCDDIGNQSVPSSYSVTISSCGESARYGRVWYYLTNNYGYTDAYWYMQCYVWYYECGSSLNSHGQAYSSVIPQYGTGWDVWNAMEWAASYYTNITGYYAYAYSPNSNQNIMFITWEESSGNISFTKSVNFPGTTYTVTKKVTGGSESDYSKAFKFQMTINGSDQVFYLSDGQSRTFSLGQGDTYSVKELTTGYTTTWSGATSGTVAKATNSTYRFSISGADGYPVYVDGTYRFTLSAADRTVHIEAGQTVEVRGIPAGRVVTVSEDTSALTYDAGTTGGSWSENITSQNITVVSGTTTKAAQTFVNTFTPDSAGSAVCSNSREPVPVEPGKTTTNVECSLQLVGNNMYSQDFMDAEFNVYVERDVEKYIENADGTYSTYIETTYPYGENGTVMNPSSFDSSTFTAKFNIELWEGDRVTITETKAPKGYLLPSQSGDTDSKSATVGTTAPEFTFRDMPTFDPVLLTVNKKLGTMENGKWTWKDEPGIDVEGAVFLVSYYDNTDCSGTPVRYWYLQTDEDGDLFYWDTYLVTDFDNEKYYDNGTPTYQIPSGYEWSNNGDLYTDASGMYDLPLGSFTVQEVWSPAGYELFKDDNGNAYVLKGTVTQLNDGQASSKWITTAADFDNRSGQVLVGSDGSFTFGETELVLAIKKLDSATGEALSGAKFRITDVNDSSKVYEFTSDENQEIHLVKEFLELGHSYTLEEVDYPDGYVKWEDTVTFHVDGNGDITFDDVLHTDEEGNEFTYAIGKAGTAHEDYEVQYDECVISDDGVIGDSGAECYLLVINNIPNEVHITKTDINGDPLSGVDVEVYVDSLGDDEIIAYLGLEKDAEPVYNHTVLTTDSEGKINLYKLRSEITGTEPALSGMNTTETRIHSSRDYIFREIKTSEGKNLLADAVVLRVTENGRILGTLDEYGVVGNETRKDGNISYEFDIRNYKTIRLMTGGTGYMKFYIIGGVMALGAAAMAFIGLRRRKYIAG